MLTLILVAANLAVAFWAPFSLVTERFAFDPSAPTALTAFTCLFLHDPENILHLLGNLVFLAAVGPLVESSLGPAKFITVYLGSGIAGVGAHWAIAVGSGVTSPLIGASASIAGCVGYCCVRYIRHRVPVVPGLRLPVAALALVWVLLQAVGAFVKFGGAGGSSYVAHIGGFLAGLVLAFVFRAQTIVSLEEGQERISAMSERSPAATLAAAEGHLRSHPEDTKALWQRADALHAMGEAAKEADSLTGLLRSRSERDAAVLRLAQIGALASLPSVERMRLSVDAGEEAKRALLESVVYGPADDPERPYALLALAEHTDDRDLLDDLKKDYAFHAATEIAKAKGLIE